MAGLMDMVNKFSGGAPEYKGLEGTNVVTKAKIIAYKSVEDQSEIGSLELFLNPETIQISKKARIEDQATTNTDTRESRAAGTDPVQFKIGKLWFDTFESRKNVRKEFIDKLEAWLDYDEDTHQLPVVRFTWGKFNEESNNDPAYVFWLESLDVNYTMFLPDGTPVRAEVSVSFKQARPATEQQEERPRNSPDHAKLYTVRRGDTLQGIAMFEYDDPHEWRRIATLNNINDPMNLQPGTKLLVPPIIK